MPIYSYKCTKCKEIFDEFWISFHEAEENEQKYIDEAKCPKCQSIEKIKIMGNPMIIFRGSGWTKKSIIPDQNGRYDSTGAIKEHVDRIKEETKNLKSKDLYKNTDNLMKEE